MYRWIVAGAMGSILMGGAAEAQEFKLGGLSGFYGGISIGGVYALEQTLIDDNDEIDIQGVDVDVAVEADAEYDFGYGIAAQLGYYLSPNLRTEAEIGYQAVEGEAGIDFEAIANGQDITDQVLAIDGTLDDDVDVEASVIHLTVGAYYDLNSISLGGLAMRPYLGGALGFAKTEIEVDGFDDEDDTTYTVHGELGVAIDVTPNLAIVPAYRLQYVPFDKGDAEELYLNNFKVGARFSF